MVSRRTVLMAVGSCLTASTAGCIGGDGDSEGTSADENNGDSDSAEGDGDELLSLGESVTTDELELSVETYERMSEYIVGNYFTQRSAPDGAVIVSVKISVSHVGETQETFPASEDITMFYLDETAEKIVVYADYDFRAPDGTTFTQYVTALDGAQSEGVFPGTEIQGWLVFLLPEDFDQTEAEIRIDEDGETYAWRLSE